MDRGEKTLPSASDAFIRMYPSTYSCSSYSSRVVKRRKRRGRRKKAEPTSRVDGRGGSTTKPGSAASTTALATATGGSRWEEFAKKRQSELNRFMKSQTHALSQVWKYFRRKYFTYHYCEHHGHRHPANRSSR